MSKPMQDSALLLISRALSIGLNLATQIITIHYLTQVDFGILAITLLVFESISALPVLGLDRALTRVLPGLIVAQQQGAFRRVLRFATGRMGGCTLLISGLVLIAIHLLELDTETQLVALILFVLLPLGAIDRMFEGFLAALDASREIARRKYVFRPISRLVLVGAAIALDGGVLGVALAHCATYVIGTLVYVRGTRRVLRTADLGTGQGDFELALQSLKRYARPQYGTDVTLLTQAAAIPTVLTAIAGSAAMAAYYAIVPFARLNMLVIEAISPVYTPGVSRLLAEHRPTEINALYWRTAAWVVILTFPMLAMTTVFADIVIATFLDERYASSAALLAIASMGYFAYGLFGFTTYQLQVEGRGTTVFRADVALLIAEIILAAVMVDQWGALGAALALALSLASHALIKRVLLSVYTTLVSFEGLGELVRRVYLPVPIVLGALWLLTSTLQANLLIALVLTAAFWVLLLWWARPVLALGEALPVLSHLPVIRWLV